MTTILQNIPANSVLSKWALIWLAVVAALVALLTILTVSVSENPSISQDLRIMKWIVDWDLPGLTTYFNLVSAVTHTTAGIVYGVLGVTFLILLGKTRPAIAFLAVGLSIAVVALAADHSLGVIVDRGRPLDPSHLAFPSGHTYGTTVFFYLHRFLSGLLPNETQDTDSHVGNFCSSNRFSRLGAHPSSSPLPQ